MISNYVYHDVFEDSANDDEYCVLFVAPSELPLSLRTQPSGGPRIAAAVNTTMGRLTSVMKPNASTSVLNFHNVKFESDHLREVARERSENPKLGTPNKRPIVVTDANGVLIARFSSGRDASIYSGLDQSSIIKCCRGKQRGGSRALKFFYEEDYDYATSVRGGGGGGGGVPPVKASSVEGGGAGGSSDLQQTTTTTHDNGQQDGADVVNNRRGETSTSDGGANRRRNTGAIVGKKRPADDISMKQDHHQGAGVDNTISIPASGTANAADSSSTTRQNRGNFAGPPRAIDCYTLDGQFVRSFSSQIEAARTMGICSSSVSNVCMGHRKSCGGYFFKVSFPSSVATTTGDEVNGSMH
jgi:hypothetical protein